MKPLLDDYFTPITKEIGFLECEVATAFKAYADWMAQLQAPRGVRIEVRDIAGDLPSKIAGLLPLTSVEIRRALFLPTASRWCAYLDNGWRGTDAGPVTSFLSRTIRCQGIRALYAPNTINRRDTYRQYGATVLEIYSPIPEECHWLNTKRSICAANDGGRWTFHLGGTPQDFEEPENYQARRMRDRFTPEMLARYLKRLGIEFFSNEFYGVPQPAYLISKVGPRNPSVREYTLEEARKDWWAKSQD